MTFLGSTGTQLVRSVVVLNAALHAESAFWASMLDGGEIMGAGGVQCIREGTGT